MQPNTSNQNTPHSTPTDLAPTPVEASLETLIRTWQSQIGMEDIHDLEELLDDGVALLRQLVHMQETAGQADAEMTALLTEAKTFLEQFE